MPKGGEKTKEKNKVRLRNVKVTSSRERIVSAYLALFLLLFGPLALLDLRRHPSGASGLLPLGYGTLLRRIWGFFLVG